MATQIPLIDTSEQNPPEDAKLDHSLHRFETFLRLFGFCQYSFWSFILSRLAFLLVGVAVPIMLAEIIDCADCEKYEIKRIELEILVSVSLVAAISLGCVSHNIRKYGVRKFLFVDRYHGLMLLFRDEYIQRINVQRPDSALREEKKQPTGASDGSAAEASRVSRKREGKLIEEEGGGESTVSEKMKSTEKFSGVKQLHEEAALCGVSATASKKLERLSEHSDGIPLGKANEEGNGSKEKIVTATKKGMTVLDQRLPDDIKADYHVLQLVEEKNGSAIGRQPLETQLEPCIANFISLIFNVDMMEIGYNADKLPLGTLSKSTILKVEALGEIEVATKLLKDDTGMQGDPLYSCYRSLHCELTPVGADSDEFDMINKYMRNTHAKRHSTYTVDIVQIFRTSKEGEVERFRKFSGTKNRMLLWHGSRLTNWVGILSQGLRIAPPEAPVTDHMFGEGVYFADMFSKSAKYCRASNGCTSGVLLLCEVALGDMAELLTAKSDADKLPVGKLSTKGVGGTAPDFSEALLLDDGVVVPLGRQKENTSHEGSLRHNEYIVYNVEQIRNRYVVQVKFNFKND